jgi:hypothetical protein|tara:strand:+ start:685 stop:888 length:204 start_codon:yes stop_codon:yes gene_type:complete
MYLQERLKPEHQARLKNKNFEYPLVVEEVSQELESKTKVSELSYGVVMSLHTLLNNYGSPYELFNEL